MSEAINLDITNVPPLRPVKQEPTCSPTENLNSLLFCDTNMNSFNEDFGDTKFPSLPPINSQPPVVLQKCLVTSLRTFLTMTNLLIETQGVIYSWCMLHHWRMYMCKNIYRNPNKTWLLSDYPSRVYTTAKPCCKISQRIYLQKPNIWKPIQQT